MSAPLDLLAAGLYRLRRLVRRHWPLVPMLLLLGYLVHAALWGQRGWFALREAERALATERAEVEALRRERDRLAGRVEALRGPAVDADLVESELRRLGYVRKDELVVLPPGDEPSNPRMQP